MQRIISFIHPKFSELLEKAKSNDLWAQFEVGKYYEEGYGLILKDNEEAFSWYLKSAIQGHRFAECKVASFYANGTGVEQSRYDALKWYHKIITYYERETALTETTQRIFNEAERCYEKLIETIFKNAQEGNAVDQCLVGNCYENGWKVDQDVDRYIDIDIDIEQALSWYQRASDQNHEKAWQHMRDLVKKVIYKEAEAGRPSSQYLMGICFENGWGIWNDEKAAFSWFEKSRIQRYADAQYKVALCYENGRRIEKNETQAFEWYQRAAWQENANAEYALGICYEHGRFVKKDARLAFSYYDKAASRGLAIAQHAVGRFWYYGLYFEKDVKKAINYFQQAAKRGIDEAAEMLRHCRIEEEEREEAKAKEAKSLPKPSAKRRTASASFDVKEVKEMLTLVQQHKDQIATFQMQLASHDLTLRSPGIAAVHAHPTATVRAVTRETKSLAIDQAETRILADKNLSRYYLRFIQEFSGIYTACLGIKTNWGGRAQNTEELVATGINEIGSLIPGLSIAPKVIAYVIKGKNLRSANKAVAHMAAFFIDPSRAFAAIKQLALQLTLAQTRSIESIIKQGETFFGKAKQLFRDAKELLLASGNSDAVAMHAIADVIKITEAIMCGDLAARASVEQMKSIIVTEEVEKLKATPAPILDAPASPPTPTSPLQDSADILQRLQTVEEKQKRQNQEHAELKRQFADTLPPDEDVPSSEGDQVQAQLQASRGAGRHHDVSAVHTAVLWEEIRRLRTALALHQERLDITVKALDSQQSAIKHLAKDEKAQALRQVAIKKV